jgi:peptidyl-prolyl cis-trans isomerase SurA
MNPASRVLPSRIRHSIAFGAALLTALAGLSMAPVWGQSAIRILVNDQPITTYDVQQRTKMIRTFSRDRQGEKEAIEQLINERLMLQEAARRRVEIGDAEVEAEFASRARSAKLSAAQFGQAMREAGFDPKTFKDFLRANMAWAIIVRSRFRATVSISEQDVAAALTERETPENDKTSTEYLLQQIIFIVPKGGGAGVAAQQRKEAAAFRESFQGCDQSLQQAGGKPGIVIKPPSRREDSQISPELKANLEALGVGGVTQPEQVADGIQLLAVCARNEITGQTEAQAEVRQELSSERGELLARRYLRDLRSDAVIEYR